MLANMRDLLKHDREFLFGFVVILVLIFLSILSFFSPYDPRSWNVVPHDLPPSLNYPFGTNSVGQDVFWIMTYAIRGSFLLGIIVVLISRTIAILVGLTAGSKGGIGDRILMTLNDGFVVIPALPMLIFFGFVLKEKMNVFVMGTILAIFGWAWDGRLIRSLALSLREREFTHTALFSGMSTFKVILKEHMPFVVPLVMATSMTNMLWAIGMEVTLAVFGLSSLDMPTLGTTIYWANEYQAMLTGVWWWMLAPVAVCIFLFVALYMLSTSISRFLDPRTRLQKVKLGVK